MQDKFLEKFSDKLQTSLGISGVKIYKKAPDKGMIDTGLPNYGFIKPLSSIEGPKYDMQANQDEGCWNYFVTADYFFIAYLCDCNLDPDVAHEKILKCFMKYCYNGSIVVRGSSDIPEDIFAFDTGEEKHHIVDDENIYIGIWFQATTEIEDCNRMRDDFCLFKVDEEALAE